MTSDFKNRRASAKRSKVASTFSGSVSPATVGSYYSASLSTDFLELPQSADEKRNFCRHFYETHPIVGQAIDLHTDIPISKIRLSRPKSKDPDISRQAHAFCQKWADRVDLLRKLLSIVHERTLLGEAWIWCEDLSPDMPRDVTHEVIRELNQRGEPVETEVERPDATDRSVRWLKKNYSGWTDIRVLPPEQIYAETYPFAKEKIVSLIPDHKTVELVRQAHSGDVNAKRVVDSMPQDIVEACVTGSRVTLNTNPHAGSYVYHMTRQRCDYEPRGRSILERCFRDLLFQDKLRQSQTQIASRHMTPIRLVSSQDLSMEQLEDLKMQVDLALVDPDYSIVTNYEINWQEIGSDQRIPDFSSLYEVTDRRLYAGLGVTESLLSGESSYSGDRINLEIINVRYMLLREELQQFVEKCLLEPMCRRMGFVEEGEDGNLEVVVPKLSFTRLALRDNSETQEQMFNLFQKGSLDSGPILENLNLDPDTVRENLIRDAFTVADSKFNDFLSGVYNKISDIVADNSDAAEKVSRELNLRFTRPPPEQSGGRF